MATLAGSTTEQGPGAGGRREELPQAHLFRVMDCAQPLLPSARHGLRDVDLVVIGRGPAAVERSLEKGQRVLRIQAPDPRISTAHAQLRRTVGRWLVEDLGSTNGTLVDGQPVRTAALEDGSLVEIGRTFFLYRQGVLTGTDEPVDLTADQAERFTTLSPPFAARLRALEAIATSMVSVILQGETGTGKEVLARAIHAASRRPGAFVPLNCGAIPEALVESELFGVRRGAFSDAREDRPGLVRTAHEGTLFLDEIGDLQLGQQTAFLRVLQEREVVPIGQTRGVAVDLRVVSASHRDLEALAGSGGFREDLLARLSGFTVRIPPLRARREDLGLLVAALVSRLAREPERVTFHPDAMRRLMTYAWPRNVRELEKRLGAALVLAGEGPVQLEHLGDFTVEKSALQVRSSEEEARHAELTRLLEEHHGNLSAVAKSLGKDRVQVRRWLRKLGIDALAFRAREPR